MSYHMPPKYIGLFSKEDKHGKLQWKIIPCDTKEEVDTSIEIMIQSGCAAECGFRYSPESRDYERMT